MELPKLRVDDPGLLPDVDSVKTKLLFVLIVCLCLCPFTTSSLLYIYANLIQRDWIYYPGQEPTSFVVQFIAVLVCSRVLGHQISTWNRSLFGLFKSSMLATTRGVVWSVSTIWGVVARVERRYFGRPEDDQDEHEDQDSANEDTVTAAPAANENTTDDITRDGDAESKDAGYYFSLLDDVPEADSDYVSAGISKIVLSPASTMRTASESASCVICGESKQVGTEFCTPCTAAMVEISSPESQPPVQRKRPMESTSCCEVCGEQVNSMEAATDGARCNICLSVLPQFASPREVTYSVPSRDDSDSISRRRLDFDN